MLKKFSRNRSWKAEQDRLFFALEKIVNVALVKTERGDNQSVKEILNELEVVFRRFWQLKKENPDKFDSLLWSKDFFDKYVMPSQGREKDLTADASKKTKSAEDLKTEASLLLSFTPDKQLKGLTVFLNSFEKIWKSALRNDNDEITRYVVYHLNWLLAELAQEPSNGLFIEEFLRLLNSIAWTAIKNSKGGKDIDPSVYSASFRWYTDIVFNRLRQKQGNFDLSYLEQFDKHFFSNVKYMVSENQTSLFQAFVHSLVDGLLIATYNEGKIWDYGYLILYNDFKKYGELEDKKSEIGRRIEELAKSEHDLYTKEKLDSWIKKFDELKEILEPYFDAKQKEEARRIEEDIRDFAVSQFKYNNLLGIVFAIGAYCLFKQKLEYIKYLWEYKEPPDADGSWVGHDIVPNTIDMVVSFYFSKGIIERRFDFWEDHHGNERYYNQYFVLLLARVLEKAKPTGGGTYEQIEHYNLPDLDVHRLSDLGYSVDVFIKTGQELKGKKDILSTLGFEVINLDELFDRKLIPFLEILKTKAQEKIKDLQKKQTISQRKVDEFRDKVLEEFNRLAVLRDIFKYCRLYEDRTKQKFQGEPHRLGINIVDDKAAFFEEWHIHFLDWGKSYGEDLASGEDSLLLNEISKDCQEIREEQFEEILAKFNLSDIIIFVTNIALHRYFENSESFKPKWYRDTQQLDIRGFQGWYEYKGQPIPIFETYRREIDKQILILNKSRLGKLVQYSPLDEGEKEAFIKDIFYINVQAFSENSDLMDSIIKEPPEWLKKIGDEGKQRDHLQERVLIHIFERFEYEKSDKFEGYRMKLAG